MNPEQIEPLTNVIADAIRQAVQQATQAVLNSVPHQQISTNPKPPPFSFSEYRSTDEITVCDYFTRLEWALKLSKIPEEEYANYARVNIGAELNNALKVLMSPRSPDNATYSELKNALISHFDAEKNKYAESIKFRRTLQENGETMANFALRLKQATSFCEYAEFLDRMLIEQFLVGLKSQPICDEIIAKKPSTFREAYEIAHALESSHQTTTDMKTSVTLPQSADLTNKVGTFSQRRNERKHAPNMRQGDNRIKRDTNEQKGSNTVCYGCGGQHQRKGCKFLNATCYSCGKTGHISRVCNSKTSQLTEEPETEIDFVESIHKLNDVKTCKRMISTTINGTAIQMELDTGAPCGMISKIEYQQIKATGRLRRTDRNFCSYTGHKIQCLGRAPVNVKVGATTRRLNVYVVDGKFDSLFGREWISQFTEEIDFRKLFSTSDQILNSYDDVFGETAGKLVGPPIKCHFKPDITPVFSKAREIPIALRESYAAEIDSKIASGFYERVEFSEWASTTHVVTRKNGKIRVTGNYKPTLNPRIIIDEYPIPRAEHLFNKMSGAKIFCHLDITDAYSHLPIDREFSHALTLNTPTHGLIRPTRAVYGAANIPAIWQRRMETVLQGVANVCNFFDDMLIYAVDFDAMLLALQTTLDRLREQGLRLNRSKCVFAAPAVEFLGHKIDSNGIHKSDKHIEAVRDAPKPTNVEELQLFLGKATYYSAFIPNLSTRDRPLRDVLLNDEFIWTDAAEDAYQDIKKALISPQVLMPYDPSLPLVLATDASKTGLGAVLSQRVANKLERPVAYASRTLTPTEQKYPQMDKEALAIVWAVQKFFLYLYARHWTLVTDHKPLSQILHPHKSLPVLCISRMSNYADFLSNFDIEFRNTKANINADYCSRAIRNDTILQIQTHDPNTTPKWDYDGFDNFMINQIRQLPVRNQLVVRETSKDEHLGHILRLLEEGKNLKQYGFREPETNYKLTTGCLTYDHRVVIPDSLRGRILDDLHTAHLGVVKMKGLARSFVYWPGIDADIENIARKCADCARNAHNPAKFRQHHWEYPKGPWERIHVDYAGPFEGAMLLIITDAFSKWVEVKITNSVSTAATVNVLDELFAAYGVPVTIVSDNGTCFTSAEFRNYLGIVGVKYHKRTAPYHPSSNGQVERYVQTVKDALKNMGTTRRTLQENLNEFLRQYRKAPHSTTGQSPSQLFLGRTIRTRLDIVYPTDIPTSVMEKQYMQFTPTYRTIDKGARVQFLSGNPRMEKWLFGTMLTRLGDLHYEVDYKGKRVKRHIDQIRNTGVPDEGDVTSRTTPKTQTSIQDPGIRRFSSIQMSPQGRSEVSGSDLNYFTPTQLSSYSRTTTTEGSECHTGSELANQSPGKEVQPIQPKLEAATTHDGNPGSSSSQRSNIPVRRSTRIRKRRLIYSP
ncbi:uncharacterized protein K02A2.6-like isoform X2 [Lucilia sericata]|uniref:uncharacterized protein K02A2.6-like isoform X2 n=1 Tax=Lucilia sericata TaxID=13632 RepID=UPI0018A87A01|nr:uncharacterized protein K02A2.6-like isoform X2 [Lucilia sericata]